MSEFKLRLYWKMGEHDRHDPPLVTLLASEHDQVLQEAEGIWFNRKDDFEPKPVGYLVYHCESGKIVLERRERSERESPRPAAVKATGPKSPRRLWWRLWSS